ncbi:Os04g0528651 [Oryza sativa Japonica Group]|uniref:Os04g0528651 protein n=1 Tax=Oryza sativa subsp. japonica TaxID=39947 RepID=A0A0P0WCY7_ORYSJ|nr:hypothetical protein EE612_024545 [Oryza sativa]BAS90188.1 Os04g0528651 [Oryza sativa Japonica Group]
MSAASALSIASWTHPRTATTTWLLRRELLLALPRQLQWADRAAAELLHLVAVVGLRRCPCPVGGIDGTGLPRGRPRVAGKAVAPGGFLRLRLASDVTHGDVLVQARLHQVVLHNNLRLDDERAAAGDLAVAVPPVCRALVVGRPVQLEALVLRRRGVEVRDRLEDGAGLGHAGRERERWRRGGGGAGALLVVVLDVLEEQGCVRVAIVVEVVGRSPRRPALLVDDALGHNAHRVRRLHPPGIPPFGV